MEVELLLTIGQYVFVALLYLFLIVVFRMLILRIAAPQHSDLHRTAEQKTSGEEDQGASQPESPSPSTPRVTEHGPVAEAKPVADQSQNARLVVETTSASNLGPGAIFALGESAILGRKAHNDITLDDRYVSATHALIIEHDENHILRDYHSTNGTWHNGVRIQEDVVLTPSDEISIGTTTFHYQQ